ncbi:DUF413 domain-containing protein [Shewanella gelidii]|uniref:Macrodomain Ori protein n=1 Tax=Shewanella gelidii TaxID=1642821 RepID=A0A917JJE2_9GAMM|nr:DUF413 domain-containing protein [Shewanella gelidii]MCL1097032.1 DUF413 domain-containing protein [Shewanella gelidii]GGI72042.1 hypothetical protein GCM10009332_06790 [Shewanella gelidii]
MTPSTFSTGSTPFYDDVNFPRGFNRSGDFSCREAQMLHQYGNTMRALAEGFLMPINTEEARFVEVIQGAKEAKTPYERVWMKYITLTQTPKLFFSLAGGRKTTQPSIPEAASD